MKNKKKLFIIGGILLTLLVIGLVLFLVFKDDDDLKKKNAKKSNYIKCNELTGGSYNILFETNGGSKIENMKVCIACAPDTYEDLPVAKKDGEVFAGWYFDKDFKKEVTATNSIDIDSVTKKDKNGCIVGYEDITLYAKWSKEEVKTLKVTFDSNGGSKVNSLSFKCVKDNSAEIKNLPKSKKDGYTFISWIDKNEVSILDGAKIECNGELKLKAKWEKNETPNPEPKKDTTYKCDSGWTLVGSTCERKVISKNVGSYKCSEGETKIGNYCVAIAATSDTVVKQNTVKTCKKETIGDQYGHTIEYDGVLFADNVTCYYKEVSSYSDRDACLNGGYKWNSSNGKCYSMTKTNNTTSTCKDPDNYVYVSNAESYVNGKNGGCYPKKDPQVSCPKGYDKYLKVGSTIRCYKIESRPATPVE